MPGVKGRSGGHNRISDREKQINGEAHKNRYKGAENPPALLSGIVDHAEFGKLGAGGKRLFNILFPMLENRKVLSKTDSLSFYLLCDAYDMFENAKKRFLKNAFTVKEVKGKIVVVKRPEFRNEMEDARKILTSYLKDFGCDPDARSRIIAIGDGDEKEDEIESVT